MPALNTHSGATSHARGYNYIDLGNRNLSFTYNCGGGCGFANPYTFQDKQTLQTVLVGVNWRFGGL